jgi:hypothetical protein
MCFALFVLVCAMSRDDADDDLSRHFDSVIENYRYDAC